MIPLERFQEDQKLKYYADSIHDSNRQFDWRGIVKEPFKDLEKVRFQGNGKDVAFDLGEIAHTIGSALTALALSRQESEIFNETNQKLVANLVDEVGQALSEKLKYYDGALKLSKKDLYLLIEKALIEKDAHDIARSLVQIQAIKGAKGQGKTTGKIHLDTKIIRRNGQSVPWMEHKIEVAVRKAFLSLQLDSEPAIEVAESVTERIRNTGQRLIHIEEVQDLVQENLMRGGHFKVAEAYIIYRAHQASVRESEQEISQQGGKSTQESMIMVQKEGGETFFWDGKDLRKRIEFGMLGLELCLSAEQIEIELRRSLYAEISEKDLKKTVLLNAKTLIEKDSEFAKFSGRILLSYIYEEVLDWDIVNDGIQQLKTFHRKKFKGYLKRAVELDRINPKLLETYDLDILSEALDPVADMDFDYLGIQTLYDRYLIVDKSGASHCHLEVPQFFWMRVAMGLFLKESKNKEDWVIKLYRLYKGRRFCSSTPTLFNSGTLRSQLSSCYLYKVDDSIESIMQRGIADNAYLSKWAGGLGGSWTAVRGTGSHIHGTNGESQGVIPFLKLHNDQLVAVNQGGKRRGSGCAYLETWHNDVVDFLELRKNTGDERRRTHDMNTANWIPDLFMKRMEAREDWSLFRSNEVPDLHDAYGKDFEQKYCAYEKKAESGEIYTEKMPSIQLWKKMLSMIFETGHPWITFKDPCNVRNPQDHTGVIHSSNLCTEITLNTGVDETAVCNLGSIILENHITEKGELDLDRLRETIRIAIRALDNVIDINFYPTESAKNANMRHRPIGLGVMGLQNALYLKGISFASEDAVEFNDEFMEAIAYFAYEASSDLADERAPYHTFTGSKWDRGLLPQDTIDILEKERGLPIKVPRGGKMNWDDLRKKIDKQGMRNSNVLAIAPTATISNIMGSHPCIEPTYKNLFVKSNLGGEFVMLNHFLVRDLKKLGLWTDNIRDNIKYYDGDLQNIEEIPTDIKQRYLTAFDIDYQYLIDAAARRQKWIDQAQSVNLFIPEPDLKVLSHMYRDAWHKGLKTTYYLRSLGASNIEKATISLKKSSSQKTYSKNEQQACSVEASRNGEECEACQ